MASGPLDPEPNGAEHDEDSEVASVMHSGSSTGTAGSSILPDMPKIRKDCVTVGKYNVAEENTFVVIKTCPWPLWIRQAVHKSKMLGKVSS